MLQDLVCRPGAYVEIVPLGLLCTLQYNSNGILQQIMLGFDPANHTDADVFTPDLTIKLKEHQVVPQRIPFNQGTSWVKGVFYTSKPFKAEGVLPNCLQSTLLEDLRHHIDDYKFYAGDLSNDTYNFAGGQLIATRLSTFGFEILPGYLVFDDVGTFPIEETMRSKKSPFKFPLISGLMIYDSVNPMAYLPAELEQYTVTSVRNYWDDHGFISSKVNCDDHTFYVEYTDMVRHDISAKAEIIVDDGQVLFSRKPASFFNNKLSKEISCTVCGRKIVVPPDGHTHCADEHCPSMLYPRLKHFLSVLDLPEMTFETFRKAVKSKEITCLLDIFSFTEYETAKIECTLSNLLFAVVPFEVCRSVDFFQKFTNYLGSVEALDYYLENPNTILTDLNLNPMYAQNFVNWLNDPYNVLEIKSLLQMDQIKIQSVRKKFDAPPIFRGKTICVTGKFKHGTLEDVIAILQSYAAKVTTKFDNTVMCVVVGHFEDEDKGITDLAVSYNVPIFSEDDFFKSYEIDLDIKKQRDALSSYLNE